ncbi:MAG TPA: galactofuranose ABC transporter, permease protein YjfF [Tepidisphaeraceae bacterium]|nr:galactofuranose ABC transporter, permease protein YjfF [Tepidisphaeraceae bacterium]
MSAHGSPPTLPPGDVSPRASRRLRLLRAKHIPLLATLFVCSLLYTAAALRYDYFASAGVFVNFFRENAPLGIAAVGLTFVILSGGIDLSVGSVIACTGVLIASLAQHGWNPWTAMPVALACGAALGLVMGCLIHFFQLAPFLVTLAGLFLARGIAAVISLESIALRHPTFIELSELSLTITRDLWIPLSALVFVAVAIVAALTSVFTPFGRNVYAIGGDEHSAVLMGLPVGRTKIAIYTLSGFCSALGGVVYAVSIGSGNATAAVGLELDAIAAVVIGGTLLTGGVGSIWGTVIGVLILAIIQTALIFEGTLSSWWARIIIGGLLLIFIALQKLLTRRTEAAQ